MPSASRAPTPVPMDLESIESRHSDLDNQTVGFETNEQDFGAAPYIRGAHRRRWPRPRRQQRRP